MAISTVPRPLTWVKLLAFVASQASSRLWVHILDITYIELYLNFNKALKLNNIQSTFLEKVSKLELLLIYTDQGWEAGFQSFTCSSLFFIDLKSKRGNIPIELTDDSENNLSFLILVLKCFLNASGSHYLGMLVECSYLKDDRKLLIWLYACLHSPRTSLLSVLDI